MAMMAGILLFSVVAGGADCIGLYFKIAKLGGKGAAIPVCGLMLGAATGTAAARQENPGSGFPGWGA